MSKKASAPPHPVVKSSSKTGKTNAAPTTAKQAPTGGARAIATPTATRGTPLTPARNAPRRTTRQEQWEQRRLERERAARVALRNTWIRRISLIGGGVIVVGLIIYLSVTSLFPSGSASLITGAGTYTTPADGSTRDGMKCLGTEGGSQHIHMYLAVYIDGKQYQVPGDTGVVNNSSCLYPLHVHSDSGDANIIHEESPNNATYTLGAFFDIWGQPLSRTKVLSYTADASHKLVFVTVDGTGHKTTVTGNPLGIKFAEHETMYVLYNSPNVALKPFTQWLPGE